MINELKVPTRILMGPGPSTVNPHVLKAISTPLLGHLDPEFLKIMNDTTKLLQLVFETENVQTMAMPGTGSAGMESVFVNLLEPGDKVIICVHGLFGERMVDVVERIGCEVVRVDAPWGSHIDPEQVALAIADHPDAKMLAIVQAETSTGVLQPLPDISGLVSKAGMLFVVDAVTSLGGMEVGVDKFKIDAVYSGTQKNFRKSKVQSWYLDLNMIRQYWGQERFYHHTAPISMIYALREGLRLIIDEGLPEVFRRHLLLGRSLQKGLEAMGLELVVKDERIRLPNLTSVVIPEGIDDLEVRSTLLNDYNIEIGGGLGRFKGKAWRIGLMGYSCSKVNALLFLSALEVILTNKGFMLDKGAGIAAASSFMNRNQGEL